MFNSTRHAIKPRAKIIVYLYQLTPIDSLWYLHTLQNRLHNLHFFINVSNKVSLKNRLDSGGRKPLAADMEDILVEWIENMREKNLLTHRDYRWMLFQKLFDFFSILEKTLRKKLHQSNCL